MAGQTVLPLIPANRTADILKKKKGENQNKSPRKTRQSQNKQERKKGIIDTYA